MTAQAFGNFDQAFNHARALLKKGNSRRPCGRQKKLKSCIPAMCGSSYSKAWPSGGSKTPSSIVLPSFSNAKVISEIRRLIR